MVIMLNICIECINDESLCEIVLQKATKVKCTYCGQRDKGISIQKLAEIVDEFLREY